MAENKKSFILYVDQKNTFLELSDKEAGQLIKHIMRYVSDENPVLESKLLKIAFEPIKLQLKRDLQKWEDFKVKQAENGRLGGRPKTQNNPNNPSLLEETQKSLNVTVNDNVNVNDNNNLIQDKPVKEKFKKPTKEELIQYATTEQNLDDFTAAGVSEAFYDHFESNGWKVSGRAAMRDWKAALRTWIRNRNKFSSNLKITKQQVNGSSKQEARSSFIKSAISDFEQLGATGTDDL